jgi:hypothetical protein
MTLGEAFAELPDGAIMPVLGVTAPILIVSAALAAGASSEAPRANAVAANLMNFMVFSSYCRNLQSAATAISER